MPSQTTTKPTHHAFLGGTPQARTKHALERLTTWQSEHAVLSETCYILVQNRRQADAWRTLHDTPFPHDVRFQGVKVLSWFQWSLNWLNQSIGLAPQVVSHFRQGLGLRDSSTPLAFRQETWQLLSSADALLLLEAYWQNDVEAEKIDLLDKVSLVTHLLATTTAHDWQNRCDTHFAEAQDDFVLAGVFDWFVQHTVEQGLLPIAWVPALAWATVDFLQSRDTKALHHLCQGIRFLMVDHTHALPEQAWAWMRLLEAEGTTIWSLGDDFSFHQRLEENAVFENGDEPLWRAVSRPPFWDALKATMSSPLSLTYLPDEHTPQSEDCGFKARIHAIWQGAKEVPHPNLLHKGEGIQRSIHAMQVESPDSLDEAHRVAVAEQVLACLEASLSSERPFPIAIIVPSTSEKKPWETFISQCLGENEASENAVMWAWLEIGNAFLRLYADFPNASLDADTLHYNKRHEAAWQVNPLVWVASPDWAEALQNAVNQAWSLLQSYLDETPEDFQTFLRDLPPLLKEEGDGRISISKWLWAWLAPLGEGVAQEQRPLEVFYKRVESTEARMQSTLEAGKIPLNAWASWMHSTLDDLRHEDVPPTTPDLVQVYTLEEAPAHALHTVIVPNVFKASHEDKGLKSLASATENDTPEAFLTPLTQTLNALNELESWVHQLAGVQDLYLISNPEKLQGYNDAQRQIYHQFLGGFFRKNEGSQNADALENVDVSTPLLSEDTLKALSDLRQAFPRDALAYSSYGESNHTSLSPTDLETYVKCPRQLYYKRFKFSTPFNAKASKGTLVHKVFELYHKACNAGDIAFGYESLNHFMRQCLDVADTAFWHPPQGLLEEPAFNVYVQQPIVIRESWFKRILEAVQSLQETGFFEKTPVRVETEFRINEAYLTELSGFHWKMFVDAIYHYEDGTIRIVDYKTSKGKFEQTKEESRQGKLNRILDGLPPRNGGESGYDASVSDYLYWQLPIYIVAYEFAKSADVTEAGLQMFRSTQENATGSIFVPLDVRRFKDEKERWLANVHEEVLKPLWEERLFRANPQASYCEWCDYTSICEASASDEEEL
jgi:CRISPR/Cas system-associated exonuclease Cas4 (RecB family)